MTVCDLRESLVKGMADLVYWLPFKPSRTLEQARVHVSLAARDSLNTNTAENYPCIHELQDQRMYWNDMSV